jgi:RES domain-containing protein
MRLWRICRSAHAALDGAGGLYNSGRWHDRGTPILYTSSTPSLSALEYLVHVDPDLAPSDLVLLEIHVADNDVSAITRARKDLLDPSTISPDWRLSPGPPELRTFGTAWVRSRSSVTLCVPSAVVPVGIDVEFNALINPAFSNAVVVASRPFSFDSRLL